MDFPWPFIIIAVLLVGGVAVAAAVFEQRRRKELEAFAGRVGMSFTPGDAGHVYSRLEDFTPFGQGSSRRASNLLRGRRGEVDWEFFDYRYTTGSGKNRRTHRYGIAVANVGLVFPRMTIRPEGMFDKIASLAGFDDLNFESEAFSRRYHVKGEDRRRVYELIHPRMMEYLLGVPPTHWQFGPGVILLIRGGHYNPAQIEHAIAVVEGFLARVPSFVRDDLRR